MRNVCLLLIGLLAMGCGDDEKSPTGPGLLNENGFPLTVGNRWEYRLSGSTTSSDQSPDLTQAYGVDVVWEIKAKEIVLGQEAYRFEITHSFTEGPDQGQTSTGETWYAVQEDTLWAVASRSISDLAVWGQLFKPVLQSPPDRWGVVVLIFPLKVGKSWTFSEGLGEGDSKTVTARGEKVKVPAGEFETFRVERTAVLGTGEEVRTRQWFTDIGLVKFTSSNRLSQVRTGERGEVLGEFVYQEDVEMELLRYALK